jgi:acyl carrier protein
MDIAHVQSEVRGFIVENFLYGGEDDGLSLDASLLKRGVIDSTGVLELVAFLEERYGISVADDELVPDNLDSIMKISSFIALKKGNGNS